MPLVEEAVLNKKFVSFVSVKGEDLLPQAEAENAVKFHRLRSSVPAKLWRHGATETTLLEMQAVLTCVRWRISRKKLSIAGFCT